MSSKAEALRGIMEPNSIHSDLPKVDTFLRSLFSSHTSPLYRLMEYQLGWRDERGAPLEEPLRHARLHAGLCLLAAQAAGGDALRAVPAAAAVELLYQFTQVHVDIQECVQERHGRPTVWWVWGPAQAINAGDGFHALGRLALMLGDSQGMPPAGSLKALQALDTACLRMLEGLHQEMVYQERLDITPGDYVDMCRAKVGALLGCACEVGAATGASSSKNTEECFRRFGENLGTAFQLQEDIQMLWGQPFSGKAQGLDALNKKKGFPVIYTLAHGTTALKRELGALFFKRVLEAPDLERVVAILDCMDARASAQATAQHLFDEAVGCLDGAELTPQGRAGLAGVARWLALREQTS